LLICGWRCAALPSSNVASVDVLADAYLGDRAEVETTSLEEPGRAAGKGKRSASRYAAAGRVRAGQLPEALSVPVDELPAGWTVFREGGASNSLHRARHGSPLRSVMIFSSRNVRAAGEPPG
jgi:hypothetical protein